MLDFLEDTRQAEGVPQRLPGAFLASPAPPQPPEEAESAQGRPKTTSEKPTNQQKIDHRRRRGPPLGRGGRLGGGQIRGLPGLARPPRGRGGGCRRFGKNAVTDETMWRVTSKEDAVSKEDETEKK